MSGILVFLAFLAIAVAVAVPTIARASGAPSKPAATVRVAAAVDYFLKLDGIKGEIFFLKADGTADKRIKLSPADCANLVITAHTGVDASGPILAKTNGMPGKEPGTCVYSLKLPSKSQPTGIEIMSFSWGASKLSPQEYLKISPQEKASWVYQKVKTGNYEKSALKVSEKYLKIDVSKHKGETQLDMPVYLEAQFSDALISS